jgi:hypothetical protein
MTLTVSSSPGFSWGFWGSAFRGVTKDKPMASSLTIDVIVGNVFLIIDNVPSVNAG